MRPGGQRAKGHAFERKVANDLKAIFPGAKRGLQTRGGGKEQCDVEGTPYHIECKHGAKVDVRAALLQATSDAVARATEEGLRQMVGDWGLFYRQPFVVWRNNRGPIQVTCHLRTLHALDGIQSDSLMPVTFAYEDFLGALRRKHG